MNLFASLMRTLVPVVAGLLLSLAARAGLNLDGETASLVAASLLTAGYYAAFRALEELAGRLGWEPVRVVAGVLLGWARPPDYGTRERDDGSLTALAAALAEGPKRRP